MIHVDVRNPEFLQFKRVGFFVVNFTKDASIPSREPSHIPFKKSAFLKSMIFRTSPFGGICDRHNGGYISAMAWCFPQVNPRDVFELFFVEVFDFAGQGFSRPHHGNPKPSFLVFYFTHILRESNP